MLINISFHLKWMKWLCNVKAVASTKKIKANRNSSSKFAATFAFIEIKWIVNVC